MPTTIDAIVDLYGGNAAPTMDVFKAAGVQAVILKATQGSSEVDAKFAVRRADALANGLLVGAYHFGDGSDPIAQEANFAREFANIPGSGVGQLVALDLEGNAASQMTLAQAGVFVRRLHDRLGRWPVLYTSYGFISTAIEYGQKVPDELKNCPLWVACYGCDKPILPLGFFTWRLWQYADNRRFPGINNAFDCSKVNADAIPDMETFAAWWGS